MVKLNREEAFVIFKKPFENSFNYLSGPWQKTDNYSNLNSGYILAPFDLRSKKAYHISGKVTKIEGLPININSIMTWNLNNSQPTISLPKYIDLVKEGVELIKKSDFQKLVLSRCESHKIPEAFNFEKYFQNISNTFPECFVYLVYIPEETCWFGASPELLGRLRENGRFETIALAGTMEKESLKKGESWGEKEIVEQALVTSFILEKIKKYKPKIVNSIGPESIKTGKLIHLQTKINAEIKKEDALQLALELHPSPAVSGLPQMNAINYIIKHEQYNREYYSGFSGIIEDSSTFEFYVNLRCMQLFREEAILYAGAGITSDSSPEKEQIETANKINALKSFLNASSNTL